jgi:hypothetical protein
MLYIRSYISESQAKLEKGDKEMDTAVKKHPAKNRFSMSREMLS